MSNGGMSGVPSNSKRFLEKLQNFIKTELSLSLGKCKIGVYRQAFDYFIQEFKTYSSVLSDIKNEYESTIGELEESKRLLEPLKGKLEIIKLQNLQELNAQTRDMDVFLDKFRIENQNLKEQSFLAQEALEAQKIDISDLLKENILLREKINELHCKIADQNSEEQWNADLKLKDAEIERLHALIVKGNKKIAELSLDLQGMEENNDDFMTSHTLCTQKIKVEELQEAYTASLADIKNLEEKIIVLAAQNDQFSRDLVSLEKSFKFPDWKYIQYQVPYSVREYEVGCKTMHSNDVIAQMLAEILKMKSEIELVKNGDGEISSGKNSMEKRSLAGLDEYWNDVKSLGIELPKFLKFKGRLKNRNLSRIQTLEFVMNVFEAKKGFDSSPKNKGKESGLLDFFSLYIKKRFGSKDVLVEWAVNILYYSNHFGSSTALLNTFYKIVLGTWDISVYNYLESVISKVKSLFVEADMAFHNGTAHGVVEPKRFFAYLKSTIWSKKTKINLQSLEEVLDQNNSENLFSHDAEFVNMICVQELETSRQNLLTITSNIKGESIPYHTILDLLSKTYSNKSTEEIYKVLAIAFGKEKIKDSELINKADLLKTLSRYV